MMSESMIERVARAICRANGRDPDRLEPGDAPGIDGQLPNGDPAHFVWKHYMDEARAAIEALREPTDDMIYVGEGYCDFMLPSTHDNSGEGRRKEFRMGWQAAIDHALNPQKPT
jgi:hypothetical protein